MPIWWQMDDEQLYKFNTCQHKFDQNCLSGWFVTCQVIDLVYGEVFNRDCMKFNILIQETSLDVIICEDAHSLAEGWMC